MKTVALVTYSKQPELLDGDKLLIDPFQRHGFSLQAIPWDKKEVLWENFDLVIFRSCWDYHLRIPEFLHWLNKLETRKVNLWNPAKIVRWNMDKKYLLDLEKEGIPIIPTLIFNKETIKNAKAIINDKNWQEVVIKPTFGASAYKTVRVKSERLNPELPVLNSIFQESEVIIQPFIQDINIYGELSFIFFNKQYSHTIMKRPRKNEYRSQIEFGGIELSSKPNPNLISQAQQVIEKIDSPLLYARVDCLNNNGQLQLMELELIEPYLFFEKDRTATENFVAATANLLTNTPLRCVR